MMAIVKNAKEMYELDCTLCGASFKKPKVLPCLHSFCEDCLEQTVRGHERTVTCRTCHSEVKIPTKGIDAFPSNSFVANMLNLLAVQNPTTCTNCEDAERATSRCLDCVENLCQNCVTAHGRIRQTKSHKIVTFDELQNNAVHEAIKCPSFCRSHEREVLKYFCESCDDAICRDCAIYEHREHHYQDLKEAVKTHRVGITDLLDNTKRRIPVIRLALNEVTEVTESLGKRRDSVSTLINQTVDEHLKRLEEKRQSLLEELSEIYKEKEEVLTDQKADLQMDLSNLISSCDFVENILRYGNEAEIMLVKRLMKNRLNELLLHQPQIEPEENDIIDFFPEDEPLKTSVERFGVLTTSETFPPLCFADGSGLRSAKVMHATSFTIQAVDRFNQPVTHGGDSVVAKISHEEGHMMSADVSDNYNGTYTVSYKPILKGRLSLAVYLREKPIKGSPFQVSATAGIDCEKVGPLLTKFGSGGVTGASKPDDFYEPWGVVCTSDGMIIATDHNYHRIQIFDSNGKYMYQFGQRGKGDGEVWYPTGVAVDTKGDIFVADHGNHRIQVFTRDGKFSHSFGVRGTGEGQLKGPCGIAIDHEERLVVSDRDNHRVQVFDLDGNYVMQFGGQGSADGKMNSPRHVAITADNQIVVSDTNNFRIQRFTRDGAFVAKFGTKGSLEGQFMCPSGVAVDSENHIVVADFKNVDVQIFELDGAFVKKLANNKIENENAFSKPTGLFVSPNGNIFVADRGQHKILMF